MEIFPKDPARATVEEAREWLRPKIYEKGAVCPCCRRKAKVYLRPFNSSMAYALLIFVRELKVGEWTHFPTYLKRAGHLGIISSREWTRLRFWGFLVQKPGERDDGSNETGIYKLTQEGVDFALRRTRVKAAKAFYDERLVEAKVPVKDVTIEEALGKRFRYDEIMLPVKQAVEAL